jgi:hypothetical protein
MTDPEQEEAFEAYLKRRSVLPNALSPDERLEPPAALDAIVLNEAREALKAQAAPDQDKQQMYRAPRWAVPVALAATIMLCLSVVMNISLNTNRPTANIQRMTAARADVNARTDGNTGGDRRESLPGDIPSHEIILPEAKVAGSPAPHPPVVAEQALGPPPPSSAPMAPAPSAAPAPTASGAARESSPAYAESASPSPTDEPRVAARSAADKAAMFAKRADASVPGAAPLAAGAASDSSPATAGDRATAAARPHPADPKAWLLQIDALRSAGKTELADAEMRRFRAAFPGYAAKPAPPASSEAPK